MHTSSALAGTPSIPETTRWTWHLGALGVVVSSILVLFRFETLHAVEVWWNYGDYSHCFLIIPISAWLVWRKREQLRHMMPSLAPQALFIVPLLILVWLAGYFTAINELRQFSVVAMIIIAIPIVLGRKVFRVVAFPALYLFFLVPTGQFLVPALQSFTTWFTELGLTLLSIPHYREGTMFEMINGRWEIAEACSGLRFLIATITLGALFAHLTYRKWWKIAIFLVACVVVPVIANGLRVLLIMALAHWTDEFQTVADNHITAGHIFNSIIIIIMAIIALSFADADRIEKQPSPMEAPFVTRSGLMATVAIMLAMIATGPVLANWRKDNAVVLNASTLTLPPLRSDFSVLPPSESWHPVYPLADQEISSMIVPAMRDAPGVDVRVLYYENYRELGGLSASTHYLWDVEFWHLVESGVVNVGFGPHSVRFEENIVTSTSQRRLVWSTYWIDGQFTTNAVTVSLEQLKSFFVGDKGSALIAFSTPIDDTADNARTRLQSILSALNDLPETLNELDRPEHSPTAPN